MTGAGADTSSAGRHARLLALLLLLGAGCTSTAPYPAFKGYAQAMPVTCLVDVTLVARRGDLRVLSPTNSISALERFVEALTNRLAGRGVMLTDVRARSIGGNHEVQQALPPRGFPKHLFSSHDAETDPAASPPLPPPQTRVLAGPAGLVGDDLAALYRALDSAAVGDRLALPSSLRNGPATRYLVVRLSAEDASTRDLPGVSEEALRKAGAQLSRVLNLVCTPLRFEVALIHGDTQEVEWMDHWPWPYQNQVFSNTRLVQTNYGCSYAFVQGPYIAMLGEWAADLVPLN